MNSACHQGILRTGFSTGLFFSVFLGLSASPSQAALDFLKRDNQRQTAAERESAEGEAGGLLAEAQNREAAGDFNKAEGIYESIVKKYPRTTAAAEAQFKVGEILQVDGKGKKAFEAFQKFLTDYKGSPRYAEAVQRQFTIAEDLRNNGNKGFLGGIGADIQPSKLIEFYEQISANAPRTEMAAQARLAVGGIHAKQGDLAESIVAFESVVDEYPGTKYASEAQFNLFKLHGREASKSFSPVDLRQQREAGEDFITQFGDDPRTSDVQSTLRQLSDKEAEKAYDVGRFYERSGDFKAAAIYYSDVIGHSGSKHAADAKKRLDGLLEKDRSLAQVIQERAAAASGGRAPAPAPATAAPLPRATEAAPPVPAAPPAFEGEKPRLRASGDDVLPIPTDDPAAAN